MGEGPGSARMTDMKHYAHNQNGGRGEGQNGFKNPEGQTLFPFALQWFRMSLTVLIGTFRWTTPFLNTAPVSVSLLCSTCACILKNKCDVAVFSKCSF